MRVTGRSFFRDSSKEYSGKTDSSKYGSSKDTMCVTVRSFFPDTYFQIVEDKRGEQGGETLFSLLILTLKSNTVDFLVYYY
jgi:hypothetical protein